MSSIRLDRLGKSFAGIVAVADMDLNIGNGEFMALLGPSGCGKTTTMNMIAGLVEPTHGRVMFGERDVTGVPIGRRGVGFVFQNYAIFTHMTVYENLAYGLRARGEEASKIDARVREIAGLLDLVAFLGRRASGLSVNILQRLAIGRSAAVNPAIFLLDEPLSNVDAAFRAVMRAELRELQRRLGQTMVYVTHDQLEAMAMADRIAIMDRGVLQQVGSPIEVYREPANTFVARFMGSPSMNLLTAGVSDGALSFGEMGSLALADGKLALTNGSSVIAGFRPEDVRLTDPANARLRARAVFVERIGARVIIHFEDRGQSFKIVESAGFPVAQGDILGLEPDTERLIAFDPKTTLAIRGAVSHGLH
ncbi:ABC transporter ATP-binding protein [Mesorhizobium sp. M0701]|uniref:ABC transporter ATP-binding protein n=1 Tax=Mesorhizobium sp. M0701 TaxID=2956989 RepID=UPI0033388433